MTLTAPMASRQNALARCDLVIVGQQGGTHIGASLARAAERAGLATVFIDAGIAFAAPRWMRTTMWRLLGHRPARLGKLSQLVVATCQRCRPRWILTTGLVGINGDALRELGKLGVQRLNYATDDPWNANLRSRWFFRAVREYDHVFTVRRANLLDLSRHGCRKVSYLPFGFDADLFFPEQPTAEEWPRLASDVLFVGGAEPSRVDSIAALTRSGFHVALYGDNWNRHPDTRRSHRGRGDPELLRKATVAAKVALCLVRRANRDGQVMRTYETAAIGASMLVEATDEHRDLFGQDGDAVVYFTSSDQMLERLQWLLDNAAERARLARAVQRVVLAGQHSYDDRLETMLDDSDRN